MASQAQTGRLQTSESAYTMERNGRSRSLISQITTVLLQPVYFFRTLPSTSQWVWVALLILALVGFSAVRQPQPEAIDTGFTVEMPPVGGDPGGVIMPGGMMQIAPDGGVPLPPGGGETAAPTQDVTKTTMTALLAAGSIVLTWIVQAIILSEVSLLNGKAPQIGRNLQIAVWASVPLGLMAAFQLLYYAAGGQGGAMGLSLLLEDWTWYQAQSDLTKAVIYSLASRTTLFWLWSLVLLYLGARHGLRGHSIAAQIAVIAVVVIVVLVPVLTGAIEAPKPEAEATGQTIPIQEGMMPEGFNSIEIHPGESESSAGGGFNIRPLRPGGG